MNNEYHGKSYPENEFHAARRANLTESEYLDDWFVGYGKDESCQFEGTWSDMVDMALLILSSPNTQLDRPDCFIPELRAKVKP